MALDNRTQYADINASVDWPGISVVPEDLKKLRQQLFRLLYDRYNRELITDENEEELRKVSAEIGAVYNPNGTTNIRSLGKGVASYKVKDFFSVPLQSSLNKDVKAVLDALNAAFGEELTTIADTLERFDVKEDEVDDYDDFDDF